MHNRSDLFSQRAGVVEEPAGQCPIDQCDGRRTSFVLGSEVAAGEQIGAQSPQVAVAHGVEPDRRVTRDTADHNVLAPRGSADRRHQGGACLAHLGNGPQPLEQLTRELALSIVGQTQVGPVGRDDQHPVGAESRIERRQSLEAPDQQAGRHDQYQRQGHLADHDSLGEALARIAHLPAAGAAHGHLRVDSGRAPGGHKPEQDARGGRHRDSEGEDPEVEREVERDRAASVGQEPDDEAAGPAGEQDPGRRAQQGQQYALGEQLPRQPQAPRTHRQPHRDLVLPRRGPRQQQLRDVGAGDEQYHADHHEEREQRFPVLATNPRQPIGRGLDTQRPGPVPVLLCGCPVPGDRRLEDRGRDHRHGGPRLGQVAAGV